MKLSRRALIATAALFLAVPASLPAFAADPVPYLTPAQLDLSMMLPPPPPAGSIMDRSEIAAAIAIQKNASPDRIKLAVADADETIFDMFTHTLGGKFAEANLPKASKFFDRVVVSEDDVTGVPKKAFARTRPYLASSEIQALVPKSTSGSYPSGHTTRVTLGAIVLAAMVPEQKVAIWARADEYATSRIIGGMHYPSDLDAGRLSGTAMAAVMFTDPAFKVDFAAAKAEVRSVLGLDATH